jgi:hypothetical protein
MHKKEEEETNSIFMLSFKYTYSYSTLQHSAMVHLNTLWAQHVK